MSEPLRRLLTSPHLLSIDKDSLGVAATRTQAVPRVDLWTRPLSTGKAWLAVNKSGETVRLHYRSGMLSLDELAICALAPSATVLPVRGGEESALADGSVGDIPAHACLPVSHRIPVQPR